MESKNETNNGDIVFIRMARAYSHDTSCCVHIPKRFNGKYVKVIVLEDI
jgi:putative transposon-encoded protein